MVQSSVIKFLIHRERKKYKKMLTSYNTQLKELKLMDAQPNFCWCVLRVRISEHFGCGINNSQ